jgi:hypothetical protein
MILKPRLLMLLLVGALLVATVAACGKPAKKNTLGPGGLPMGIVQNNVDNSAPSPEESKYPIYPGSTRRAAGSYQTSDSVDAVVNYYRQLLKMEPELRGPVGEAQSRVFVTTDYTVIVIPMPTGAEIHFQAPQQAAR